MEQLLPMIHKLQDLFSAVGHSGTIELPRIVVVGGQSSGKSSVLEAIVGRDFLPRGTGIVTRRPIVMQLINTSMQYVPITGSTADTDADAEGAVPVGSGAGLGSGAGTGTSRHDDTTWAEFEHIPSKRFSDFAAVRRTIIEDTARVAGSNRGIVNQPLRLKIFSPDVVNLSLVDLPGMVKNPTGDQPQNIEEVTRNMVMEYIKQPMSIILAVAEATQDIANSDALKICREVDPTGSRTLGVITKLDLQDAGTDAVDVLQNRVIRLERGYVGVVNRSQRDINNNVSMESARDAEARFFSSHPAYHVMSSRMGTPFLVSTLNKMLIEHAQQALPGIKSRIMSMLMETQHKALSLGEPVSAQDKHAKGDLLLRVISQFAQEFRCALDGSRESKADEVETVLSGGARIAYVFNQVFQSMIMTLDPLQGLSDAQISATMKNSAGTSDGMYSPQSAFEKLTRRQIRRLETPGLLCVDMVFDELVRISNECESYELLRFGRLRAQVQDVFHALLARLAPAAHTMVANLVQMELSYINTAHPDFAIHSGAGEGAGAAGESKMDGGITLASSTPAPATRKLPHDLLAAMGVDESASHQERTIGAGSATASTTHGDMPYKLPSSIVIGAPTASKEIVGCNTIKRLIVTYFNNVVKKNFVDMVPKTIMCFLVNAIRDSLRDELTRSLYGDSDLDELLKENDDIAAQRAMCVEMKDLLTKALDIVREVREFTV